MPYKPIKKFPSKLEERTRELYLKLPRNIKDVDIAKATQLSSVWIHQFTKGKAKFVDAGRVEALYEYVAGKPLEV